jgi:hypothetical protein
VDDNTNVDKGLSGRGTPAPTVWSKRLPSCCGMPHELTLLLSPFNQIISKELAGDLRPHFVPGVSFVN